MSDDVLAPTEDEEIIREAKKRFSACAAWYSHSRQMFVEDMKFAHGDSDNQYQWPDQLLTTRELDQRPTLTINKTRIHCLQIINDAKQNKPGIVVEPTTDDASYEAAQVFEDVVRHIEYRSKAQQAYDKATENQVYGGVGYCRVVTQYVTQDPKSPDAFSQELLIKPIPDPLTVYMDPDAQEADQSDSEYAFIFDDQPREKFEREHPDLKDNIKSADMGDYDGWVGENHVRVAEYWRRKHERVVLVSVIDPQTGERRTQPRDKLSKELLRTIKLMPELDYRERTADMVSVQCFKIASDQIIDRYDWLGEHIPIVPAFGEKTVIDGQLDIKGHVRYLKDPQRMYNYYSSGAVESVALAQISPWVGPAKSFEGHEEDWKDANREALAYLPYNHYDTDTSTELPPPQRAPAAIMPDGMLKGMEVSQNELMMASGQYQSQFGQNENATSGKAINERQRQGDNATYHFVDNHAIMVRQLGRILIDMIPKIYDTPRILRIRGEDGTFRNIYVDPNAPDPVRKFQQDTQEVSLVFNPNIGRYAVEADVGPSYATRRQEAWNAIVQILTQSPQLIAVVGDLLFQNADFPGADEIAQRLRRMAPRQALEDGPNPQDQQMQQQIQQLQALVQKLNGELKTRDAETNIKAFDAETKRLVAIGNAGPIVTPEQAQPLVQETVGQMTQGGWPEQFGQPSLPVGVPAPVQPVPTLPQGLPNG